MKESFMPQSLMSDMVPGIVLNDPYLSRLEAPLYTENKVEVTMLRLDEVHPVISGNKLFKLYFFLKEAKISTHKKIITFGGAYSNHLAATAFACNKNNIACIGLVRGEEPASLSHTLSFCIENGMHLEFLSRLSYKNINDINFWEWLKKNFGGHILIPEGGFSLKGKNGASLITGFFSEENYSHVCIAVGTATTFAGIINGCKKDLKIMGFSVLKNMNDIDKRMEELEVIPSENYSFISDYHFGGYAKKTVELISFINYFYDLHKIPLDFVYTGKLMFGVNDLIEKKYFPPGAKILCLHTGGLQGNRSLMKGVLNF